MTDSIDSSHQLIIQAERFPLEVALDFSMGFETDCRQRSEILMQVLREQREILVEPDKSRSRVRVITALLQDELHDLAEKVSYPRVLLVEWGSNWQGKDKRESDDWDLG